VVDRLVDRFCLAIPDGRAPVKLGHERRSGARTAGRTDDQAQSREP
jgi:hypothetical protein